MYPTAEVRWFHRGAVPPAVVAWFRRCGPMLAEEPPRVDYYLRHIGTDTLGIKLREGCLEVKQRRQACGVVHLHQRVAGRAELWRKWSFALTEAEAHLSPTAAVAPYWFAVEKRRALHRYRLEGERAIAVAEADVPEQGCDLELTSLHVGGEDWWSLGLEAYGEEAPLQDTLLLVARSALARAEPPSLMVEDSYGYPSWLLYLEQEQRP